MTVAVTEDMVNNLEATWANLYQEVTKNRKLKFEIFEPDFSQTVALLKSSLAETTLEKSTST